MTNTVLVVELIQWNGISMNVISYCLDGFLGVLPGPFYSLRPNILPLASFKPWQQQQYTTTDSLTQIFHSYLASNMLYNASSTPPFIAALSFCAVTV